MQEEQLLDGTYGLCPCDVVDLQRASEQPTCAGADPRLQSGSRLPGRKIFVNAFQEKGGMQTRKRRYRARLLADVVAEMT